MRHPIEKKRICAIILCMSQASATHAASPGAEKRGTLLCCRAPLRNYKSLAPNCEKGANQVGAEMAYQRCGGCRDAPLENPALSELFERESTQV